MVKRTLLVLLCSLVSLGMLASLACAADEGPYVSVQAGATWLQDADGDYPGPDEVEAEFDTGYNVGLAAGYAFGPGRVEAEFAYRENDVDTLSLVGFSLDGDGDVSAASVMINGFWDIDTNSPVSPYLGAGVGVAEVSANDVKIKDFGMSIDWVDDDDTVFAYQFAAGIGFEISPAVVLDLGYRYFATDEPEFKDDFGDKFDAEYDSHSANLGVRFMF